MSTQMLQSRLGPRASFLVLSFWGEAVLLVYGALDTLLKLAPEFRIHRLVTARQF